MVDLTKFHQDIDVRWAGVLRTYRVRADKRVFRLVQGAVLRVDHPLERAYVLQVQSEQNGRKRRSDRGRSRLNRSFAEVFIPAVRV